MFITGCRWSGRPVIQTLNKLSNLIKFSRGKHEQSTIASRVHLNWIIHHRCQHGPINRRDVVFDTCRIFIMVILASYVGCMASYKGS